MSDFLDLDGYFLSPKIRLFCSDRDFFNSHGMLRQLKRHRSGHVFEQYRRGRPSASPWIPRSRSTLTVKFPQASRLRPFGAQLPTRRFTAPIPSQPLLSSR